MGKYVMERLFKVFNIAGMAFIFVGETVRKLSQAVIREHQIEPPPKGAFHIYLYIEN